SRQVPKRRTCVSRLTIHLCPNRSGVRCSKPPRTVLRASFGGAPKRMGVRRTFSSTPHFIDPLLPRSHQSSRFAHATTSPNCLCAASLCCGLLSLLPLPQHQRADC